MQHADYRALWHPMRPQRKDTGMKMQSGLFQETDKESHHETSNSRSFLLILQSIAVSEQCLQATDKAHKIISEPI